AQATPCGVSTPTSSASVPSWTASCCTRLGRAYAGCPAPPGTNTTAFPLALSVARRRVAARDKAGVVAPLARIGPLSEEGIHGAKDRPELAVVDADHNRAAGVGATALSPAAGDVGK